MGTKLKKAARELSQNVGIGYQAALMHIKNQKSDNSQLTLDELRKQNFNFDATINKLTRYWVSWEEPGNDSRPIKYPPPPPVKKWWQSGESGEDGSYTIICAVIDVRRKGDIALILKGYWKPQTWRFIEPQESLDWRPGDRFPWPEEEKNDAK